jgi:hypothetical protein
MMIMSAIIHDGNPPRVGTASPGKAMRGAALLLIGAVLGYGISTAEKGFARASSAAATAPVVEDWHGNVMRSNWPN